MDKSSAELFIKKYRQKPPGALTWPGSVRSLRHRMMEVIEKLLILQDRDRNLRRVEGELAHIGPERAAFTTRGSKAQSAVDAGKLRVNQIESERKRLELDVEAKKQLIEKYSNQQLQTRKNEEYRALAHEIETCKKDISKIEDREIELMEQAEAAQKEMARCNAELAEAKKIVADQLDQLGKREVNLQKELAELQSNRSELAAAVDEVARSRYDRLARSKGENVVVGVHHGVCGGCHMKLQPQLLVACRGASELVTCSNCGRILYYTREMNMTVAD
jgi:predicted  nucleic acid-binding Zn-ribbon protein